MFLAWPDIQKVLGKRKMGTNFVKDIGGQMGFENMNQMRSVSKEYRENYNKINWGKPKDQESGMNLTKKEPLDQKEEKEATKEEGQ